MNMKEIWATYILALPTSSRGYHRIRRIIQFSQHPHDQTIPPDIRCPAVAWLQDLTARPDLMSPRELDKYGNWSCLECSHWFPKLKQKRNWCYYHEYTPRHIAQTFTEVLHTLGHSTILEEALHNQLTEHSSKENTE